MNKIYNICIFAGTSEGRELIEYLSDNAFGQVKITACVATEYGEELIENTRAEIHTGRLDRDGMVELFKEKNFDIVIDSTHPYAKIVTENICAATDELGIEYLRLNRESGSESDKNYGKYFHNISEAVDYLCQTDGNILLTTGSNELPAFVRIPDYKNRIYPRVLPLESSLESCKSNGYESSHIIAMQGPFTKELNLALMNTFNIKILVTKESGQKGGFSEKINAAREIGAECVIIGRPEQKSGYSYEDTIKYLEQKLGIKSKPQFTIIGIGVGNSAQMTIAAVNALKNCDVIIGAKRIIESCKNFDKPTYEAFTPEKILDFVKNNPQYHKIAVVMSGDIGFYSGNKKLRAALSEYKVESVCGISSPVYFASRLGIEWENIKLCSLHGRENNIINAVKTNYRVFTLVGGDCDAASLCEILCKYNLNNVKLYIGERLSYSDEKITCGSPDELRNSVYDSLSSVIIENPEFNPVVDSGIDDDEFTRFEKVPMTKAEVRRISVSKLKLSKNSIVYDVGAGSGSVSIEAALAAYDGKVYAVERNHDAVNLIEQNKIKFGTENLSIVEGFAPQALENLPSPTHAFIGGSSGNLREIIALILKKNPYTRIVINAITLETISEALSCLKGFDFDESEIVQMSVSKSKKIGGYNLMYGQNPVYIISCQKRS